MEVTAAAGHDGMETTRGRVRAGKGQDPSLPWHRGGQQLRNREHPPKRSGSGDTVADGDVMQQ